MQIYGRQTPPSTNHSLQQLPLTHPLRLDFDAAISRLTDAQARLAATTATLDTTTAKLYTAEAQLRATESRLDEKEKNYIHLEQVNREMTDTLNQTKDEYTRLRSMNEALQKDLDSLRHNATSAVTDDTTSEIPSSETSFTSLSGSLVPSTPALAQTMDKHTLLRHFSQLHYDISQITLHPALCLRQKALIFDGPETAEFYNSTH